MKRKLKLLAVPTIYIIAICIFGISMYLVQTIVNKNKFKTNEKMEYVDKEIVTDNEYVPVVATDSTIMKPYLIEEVKINKNFYKNDASEAEQEESIITYEDMYIQNSGVDYKHTDTFDVISVLDGTVIEVTDNEILGKMVKIRHNNDLITTYGCLSEINVKVDDNVLRGQVIAKSGTCNLYPKDNNLHFEMIYLGKNINPEENYNKQEQELQA